MDRLAFTSLGAMNSQSTIRAQISNNLANVATTGFKESYSLASQAVKLEGPGNETRYTSAHGLKDIIKLNPGAVITTGNAMDVVMNDKTVLGVQAQNGEIGFTRRGDLRVSPTGVIENAAGHLILGEQGPINVPQGQLVTISADGTVYGQIPNQPDAQPEALGQLLLRDASETPLTRRPDGLFEPLDENLRGADFITGPIPVSVRSGQLEGSNANPIQAMVQMMDFSRSFEAHTKMLAEIKSVDETGSTMMRLP